MNWQWGPQGEERGGGVLRAEFPRIGLGRGSLWEGGGRSHARTHSAVIVPTIYEAR